jgi:hypothetical protein
MGLGMTVSVVDHTVATIATTMFLAVAAAVGLVAHLSAITDGVTKSTMLEMTKSHTLLLLPVLFLDGM